jgi:hypothetical protein
MESATFFVVNRKEESFDQKVAIFDPLPTLESLPFPLNAGTDAIKLCRGGPCLTVIPNVTITIFCDFRQFNLL